MDDADFDELATRALAGEDVDATLGDLVVAHWHASLMTSSDRDALLGGLGLGLDDAVALSVGISDRSLGPRIPNRQWKAGALLRGRLEGWGVLRPSGHEAFRGCLVVPVRHEGSLVALYARRLDDHRLVHYATGLAGGVFEATLDGLGPANSSADDGCTIVTGDLPDALCVYGAGHSSSFVPYGSETSYSVLAPARPKGYSTKDLRMISGRAGVLVLLGRGSDALGRRLVELGATIAVVHELDLARTITRAPDPARALAELIGVSAQRVTPATSNDLAARDGDHDTSGADDPDVVTAASSGETASESTIPTVTSSSERDETYVRFASRSWRVRGARARANVEGDRLSVALSVSELEGGRFHLDTLDLYTARSRSAFLETASHELGCERATLATEMTFIVNAAEVARDTPVQAPVVTMTPGEREEALAWLRDPALYANLERDLSSLGVVGEETNLLVCYLATLSRKCERPFGVLVQSSSAGGKSTVVDAVTSLVPPEDLVALSAVTSQALYYLGEAGLSRKVLSIAEEHGSSRAAYALKLLVSEGRLSIASTGKDSSSGRLATKRYETVGPMSLLMTTTATSIDPELENRLVVVGVNEEPSQTERIIAAQRHDASVDGLSGPVERERVRALHRNVQRLVEPCVVVIPESPSNFPTGATRHRRDHAKLLSIIATLTLLHQHQRERHHVLVGDREVAYLEASDRDVAVALGIASAVFARSGESLAPQTRRLFECVRERADELARANGCARSEVDVTRRELRELLGWSDRQVRDATDRLVALEYLVVTGGGRGRCRTYRLVEDFVASAPSSHATDVASSKVREVGSDLARTSRPFSSGVNGGLAHLAGLAHERGSSLGYDAPYAEVSYPQISSSTDHALGDS